MTIDEVRFPAVIPLGKVHGKWWVFTETFWISIKIDGVWENFKFQKDGKTDLGSVPRRLHGIVNPGTCSALALAFYLCHDNGYVTHAYRRSWYDKMLSEGISISEGFDPWDDWLILCAVKFFGGGPWRRAVTDAAYFKHRQMQEYPVYRLPVQWTAKAGLRIP